MKKFNSERDPMICSESITAKYKPDHFFLKSAMGWATMALTIVIDACVLWDFVQANRIPINFTQYGIGGFGVVAAFLLVLDVLLPITFVAMKRRYCKSDMTPALLIASSFLIVLVFVACMLTVRISLVTPETIERGSRTYPQAWIFALLPIGTSITSSLLFWMAYNPLLNKMCECEQRAYSEGEKLRSVRSELAKYESDNGDYRTRLVEEEANRYKQKFKEIQAIAVDLKVYYRRRLAEELADPKSASILCANEFEPYAEPAEVMGIPESMKISNYGGGMQL